MALHTKAEGVHWDCVSGRLVVIVGNLGSEIEGGTMSLLGVVSLGSIGIQ